MKRYMIWVLVPSPLKCKTQCLTFERGLNAYIREGCVLHLRGRTHDASRMYRYSRTLPVPVPYLLECVTWGCMSVMTPPGTPPSDCILFLACLSPSNCRTHDACDLGGGQLLSVRCGRSRNTVLVPVLVLPVVCLTFESSVSYIREGTFATLKCKTLCLTFER